MIPWRVKKQTLVLSVIILPLILAAAAFSYFTFVPPASCFDGKRNQGEIGVDCGGPCIPCELKNPKPVSVFWTRAVQVRPDSYSVAAQIQNTNEALFSRHMDYEFTLFDSLGPIAKKTGSAFLYPQERTYIVEANIPVSRTPTGVEFAVTNAGWGMGGDPKPGLIVERREHTIIESISGPASVIEATVFNRSPYDFKEVYVLFLVFDAQGNILGANKVLADNFFSNSRRTVKSIWPEVLAGEISNIVVEPRVNIFDPAVIIRP